MGCSGSQVALESDHVPVGRARLLACSPTLLCSSCVVSTSKQHSFRVREDSFRVREDSFSPFRLWLREQCCNSEKVAQLALFLNGCNETKSDQDDNGVSESNHCGQPGLDPGLTSALQNYDANRRTVEFAIEAPAERHERLKKLGPLLNGSNETNADQHSNIVSQSNHCGQPSSNETNSDQHSNVVSQSNHCGPPGLDQGLIDAVVEQFPHDAEASKKRALQIYDANRRTVEFAIKASIEREERLNKLIRAGNGVCCGSKPKRPGFVADASCNLARISATHPANEDNSNMEDNPILEEELF